MNTEYLLQGIVFSKIASIDTSSYYDLFFAILTIVFMGLLNNQNFKDNVSNFVSNCLKTNDDENVISFVQPTKGRSSNRFNALMYYISKDKNDSVKRIAEKVDFQWSRHTDNEEENSSCYRIDQEEDFNFTEDIKGRFWIKKEEESTGNDKSITKRYYTLEIFSEKLNIYELKSFVEKVNKEYKKYLLSKMLESQHILNVTYDETDKYVYVEAEKWESNVTFENRYFRQKDEVLQKLDFFLNNEDWYKKKGIPHTLGFLLHGKPGCGKTSFIKVLANYTKRHIIDIKLNDTFDLKELKDIIQKEEINDNYYIPNNKRLIVFEDIDCMGDIVKKREESDSDIKKKLQLKKIDQEKKIDVKEIAELVEFCNKKETNNLSYLLNILDGLVECNGRIIIMTTNKPDFLDPALIRPGRIDINIKFEEVNIEEFKNIFSNYYDISIDDVPDENIFSIVGKYTPAEIINRCRSYKDYVECYNSFI